MERAALRYTPAGSGGRWTLSACSTTSEVRSQNGSLRNVSWRSRRWRSAAWHEALAGARRWEPAPAIAGFLAPAQRNGRGMRVPHHRESSPAD
ncbi:MAG: hypothetical protein MZW92_04160 [Comamonadaceae bacterium]|nr:hypothetical protein [Comamonadaceae bacterium]